MPSRVIFRPLVSAHAHCRALKSSASHVARMTQEADTFSRGRAGVHALKNEERGVGVALMTSVLVLTQVYLTQNNHTLLRLHFGFSLSLND